MDFFAQQDAARRRSTALAALAALSAAPVVFLTGCAVETAFWLVCRAMRPALAPQMPSLAEFAFGNVYFSTSISFAAALLLVSLSWYSAWRAMSSGEAIMARAGARRLKRGEADVYTNVAEEMSIASGAALPTLWVLDAPERINAFAAGFRDSDAALCVTTGALRYLTRDELQGVVAHEFGHMLNGDMALNSRLAALVEGLGAIAWAGSGLLRMLKPDLSDSDDDPMLLPNGARIDPIGKRLSRLGPFPLVAFLVCALLGSALWLIGLAGRGFARLLQHAVSREREFLADAAAVQFTRNPEGLADALRFSRLLGCAWSAHTVTAANVSHMFFLDAEMGVAGTHPPVDERIRRISTLGADARRERFSDRIARIRAEGRRKVAENFAKNESRKAHELAHNPSSATLPLALQERMREADGAGAVLVSLLSGETLPECPEGLTPFAKRVVAAKAVGSIRQWGSADEVAAWADRIESLASANVVSGGSAAAFDFMVSCAVRRKLRPSGPERSVDRARLAEAAAGVISTIAALGANGDRAYALAGERLSTCLVFWPDRPQPYVDMDEFRAALSDLGTMIPLIKREFLEAVKTVVSEDGVVADDEASYLAAVADAIGAYGWKIV